MPTPTLRLFHERIAPRQARALPAATRVLYVRTGGITVSHGGAATPLEADRAWHGTGACAVTSGEHGAELLRWELGGATAEGTPVLEQRMELPAGGRWLMRCDRVDFDPGGVALPHRHRGAASAA
jgi:hypothetical protein